jgi:uncharacterized protein YyaL (SSP411 family)
MRILFILMAVVLSSMSGCDRPKNTMEESDDKHAGRPTNALAGETSPYLLQHQYNPVDWQPWGEEAFAKAKAENKLVLISIGYSACHWCHVMEHESFEDSIVAKAMNDNFVSIKVDREERPDVDQVYMNAVQLMTGRGGWPLNCFALPDGRPVFGGTYFQKEQWLELLDQLHTTWTSNPEEVMTYAERLTEGVKQSDLVQLEASENDFSIELLNQTVEAWKEKLDYEEGGPNRSPKFPIPNNYIFLHRYGHLAGDQEILDQVYLTLDKMAMGGIYDQIKGGFARYSTDAIWKAPHFEKMLYDNGQLLSLYSEGYQATGKQLYKDIVYQTYDWLIDEMMSKEGAFYSALDADSEGEEGLFYVWTEEELKSVLGTDFDFAQKLYNVNAKGRWEDGRFILLRDRSDEEFIAKEAMTKEEFLETKTRVDAALLKVRELRERPGLDDKTLTSWNALTISGLVDASLAFGEDQFLETAIKNANFIWEKQHRKDGGLYHSYKDGRSTINGYLEDYSFTAQAFIALYQATFDEVWLERAMELSDYVLAHFSDEESKMFFFTSDEDPPLITRKMEVDDNVIPASNSSMAHVLHTLGTYYDRADLLERSLTMLNNMKSKIPEYGGGYSNWASLMLQEVYPYYEIAILGDNPSQEVRGFSKNYIPTKLFMGARNDKSKLPLLEFKYVEGETMIYVCVEKSCQLPVSTVEEAMGQLD